MCFSCGCACTATVPDMGARLCAQKSSLTSFITSQWLMGAQQGATSALPLMVTCMIHGFSRPFVFITPPRWLAEASSRLRATPAHLGQKERKEF